MIDIGLALQSITASIGIARVVAEAQTELDRADLKLKMAEIITTLADAKIALSAARTALFEKDQEIVGLKDSYSGRYELVEIANAGLVYVLKVSERGHEPKHYLCPVCFPKGKRSILQPKILPAYDINQLNCFECKLSLDQNEAPKTLR